MDRPCRLCVKKTGNSTSIFSFHRERLLLDMITLICPIQIDPADDLPKRICHQCLKIITDAYELREESVKSDIQLRCQTVKIQQEQQEMPNVVKIKAEKDRVEFIDESQDVDDFWDNNEEDVDSDFEEIMIPLEPMSKRAKYDVENGRLKCPLCDKTFTLQTNVDRHVRNEHSGIKKFQKSNGKNSTPKNIAPTRCHICNVFISHATNLKRHIKNHHPDFCEDSSSSSKIEKPKDNVDSFSSSSKYEPKSDDVKLLSSSPSALTQKFLGNSRKMKYISYINIVAELTPYTFTFECLICKQNGLNKTWAQHNKGTSNIRRHLSNHHSEEFMKIENENQNFGDQE